MDSKVGHCGGFEGDGVEAGTSWWVRTWLGFELHGFEGKRVDGFEICGFEGDGFEGDGFEVLQCDGFETDSDHLSHFESILSWAYELGLTWNLKWRLLRPVLSCPINCGLFRTRTKFIDVHSKVKYNQSLRRTVFRFRPIFWYHGFAKKRDNNWLVSYPKNPIRTSIGSWKFFTLRFFVTWIFSVKRDPRG